MLCFHLLTVTCLHLLTIPTPLLLLLLLFNGEPTVWGSLPQQLQHLLTDRKSNPSYHDFYPQTETLTIHIKLYIQSFIDTRTEVRGQRSSEFISGFQKEEELKRLTVCQSSSMNIGKLFYRLSCWFILNLFSHCSRRTNASTSKC